MVNGGPRGDDDYGYAVKQTYLYLRISLVGTVAAIALAVVYTPTDLLPPGQRALHTISHYYYSPARIVFVGAVCAAALALLTLAGRGIQSYLLDIAALLAPLIAVIPTPVKLNQVATFDPKCATPDSECIPAADFGYVRLGFAVWAWLAGAIIVIGIARAVWQAYRARGRGRAEAVPPPLWWTLLAASAIWATVVGTGVWAQALFLSNAHFLSAGAFFVLVTVVACLEALRQWRRRPNYSAQQTNQRESAHRYVLLYAVIGLGLAVDLAAGVVIILLQSKRDPNFAPIGVFVVEAIGLFLFAAFFALQAIDHRHDGDGWGPLPPSRKQYRARSGLDGVLAPVPPLSVDHGGR